MARRQGNPAGRGCSRLVAGETRDEAVRTRLLSCWGNPQIGRAHV